MNPEPPRPLGDTLEALKALEALEAACNSVGTPGAYDAVPLINRATDIIVSLKIQTERLAKPAREWTLTFEHSARWILSDGPKPNERKLRVQEVLKDQP